MNREKVALLVCLLAAVKSSPYGGRQFDAIVVDAPGSFNPPAAISNNPVSSGTNCIYRHYWDSTGSSRQHYHRPTTTYVQSYEPSRNYIQPTRYVSREQPVEYVSQRQQTSYYQEPARQTYEEPARVVAGSSSYQQPVRDTTTYYHDDRYVAPVVTSSATYNSIAQNEETVKDDQVKTSAYGIAPAAVRQTLKRDAEPEKDVTQQDSPSSPYESFWVQEVS